jgi:hypothetical protein
MAAFASFALHVKRMPVGRASVRRPAHRERVAASISLIRTCDGLTVLVQSGYRGELGGSVFDGLLRYGILMFLQRRRAATRLRRVTAGGLAALIAAAACGVPLPVGRTKTSSEPYPCQDCPCGCVDAEHCWRDCCCHTNAEKLAWAREHGVTPPSFVVEAARRERGSTQLASDDAEKLPPCCAARLKRRQSRLETLARIVERGQPRECSDANCGSQISGAAVCTPAAATCDRAQVSRKLVTWSAELFCRGVRVSVGHLPPGLPVCIASWSFSLEEAWEEDFLPAPLYASPDFDVATPPPNAC